MVHQQVKNQIHYAKFEKVHSYICNTRDVYSQSVEIYGDEQIDKKLFISIAELKEGQNEYKRARIMHKYVLDHLPKDQATDLYGDRAGIEEVV